VVLGVFIFMVHHYRIWYGETKGALLADRLVDMPLTPSQRKAAKFFLVVILLFLAQTTFGGLLAHYTVHPASFYRFGFVGKLIPYSWAKSWHLQLAIFWIATTWVASAVYLAPIVGGREPRGQGTLVQLLFVAVVAVAAGSLAGEVAGIKGLLGDAWFWFGHQGWEYLELGRFWQLLLLAGLAFGAPLLAYASSIQDDRGQFALVQRFVFMPMFLFSGTFYPLATLPVWLQWIGWISPLWHATELGRALTYGRDESVVMIVVHIVYLTVLAVGGYVLARRIFTRRLAR